VEKAGQEAEDSQPALGSGFLATPAAPTSHRGRRWRNTATTPLPATFTPS